MLGRGDAGARRLLPMAAPGRSMAPLAQVLAIGDVAKIPRRHAGGGGGGGASRSLPTERCGLVDGPPEDVLDPGARGRTARRPLGDDGAGRNEEVGWHRRKLQHGRSTGGLL